MFQEIKHHVPAGDHAFIFGTEKSTARHRTPWRTRGLAECRKSGLQDNRYLVLALSSFLLPRGQEVDEMCDPAEIVELSTAISGALLCNRPPAFQCDASFLRFLPEELPEPRSDDGGVFKRFANNCLPVNNGERPHTSSGSDGNLSFLSTSLDLGILRRAHVENPHFSQHREQTINLALGSPFSPGHTTILMDGAGFHLLSSPYNRPKLELSSQVAPPAFKRDGGMVGKVRRTRTKAAGL
ncbi:unnamed protein product [Calicophoron daubneyi]|uniref:Uncharacterized protein n=1 Tax=Calicophoron daubneyi TaxID=300641 RepID=A0AAV2TI06_CALDB